MAWYWAAIIAGLLAPLVIMPRAVIAGFQGGLQTGFGTWFGIATFTAPIALLGFWIGQLLMR